MVYLSLGEPKEAAMLLGFVFVIMGITIVQERLAERALEALRDLSSVCTLRLAQRKCPQLSCRSLTVIAAHLGTR